MLLWLRQNDLKDFVDIFYYNSFSGKQIFNLNYFDLEVCCLFTVVLYLDSLKSENAWSFEQP